MLRATLRRAANQPNYPVYRSPNGPKYHYQPNLFGITFKQATALSFKAAAFGGVAGIVAIFYTSGIPRVQHDILQKIPFVGQLFTHEVPPSDNPF